MGIVAHFEKHLDFKSTHEFFNLKIIIDFNFDLKKQFWHIFETALIWKQLEFFTGEKNSQCFTREI